MATTSGDYDNSELPAVTLIMCQDTVRTTSHAWSHLILSTTCRGGGPGRPVSVSRAFQVSGPELALRPTAQRQSAGGCQLPGCGEDTWQTRFGRTLEAPYVLSLGSRRASWRK